MTTRYDADNTAERDRMRALVQSLDDEQLGARRMRTGRSQLCWLTWRSWDARVVYHLDRWEKGKAAPMARDNEPEDVDWINDASRPLTHARCDRVAAELALTLAEEADRRVAGLSAALVEANEAAGDPVHLGRWKHRRTHLDEIALALAR